MWYKGLHLLYQGKTRVTTNDRYILSQDRSLTINTLDKNDFDVYKCKILPDNIEIYINLRESSNGLKATILNGDRDVNGRSITYRQNERIELECKASGSDASKPITYNWSSGGNRLKSGDDLQIDAGHLLIEKANKNHNRVYQCLADDGSDGAVHASVTINIQCMCLALASVQCVLCAIILFFFSTIFGFDFLFPS